jgi:prepilin-type N-terminal cleavage/methylation domain-containing protein
MRRNASNSRTAFSLVEMMAAMTVLSILAVGIGTTMVIASRAVDDGSAVNAQIPEARNIGDVIIADLNDALTITERTTKSITFTVPDRDEDGDDETIRYAWDGKQGGNLTRAYNGGTAIVIADDVQRFDLAYLIRTIKPLPRACCYANGTCSDESPDDCTSNGGLAKDRNTECETIDCIGACCKENGSCVDTTELSCTLNPSDRYRGDGSRCAEAVCPNALDVLMVVGDSSSPSTSDVAKKSLMESWGYSVTVVDDGANQSSIDAAVASADVAYVCETTMSATLGSKLVNVSIGVVNEELRLTDEFKFAVTLSTSATTTNATIIDNMHYITSPFGVLSVSITESDQPFTLNSGPMASGVQVLAEVSGEAALYVVEAGDALVGGSSAAGRRVQLPWGDSDFDASELTETGKTIMKRALEWAASKDEGTPYCGDSDCDADEDPCSCPKDCGTQTLSEQASFNCNDGVDNDCDGNTDCADTDCVADASCAGVCGDSNCDAGENACNCSADCGAAAISETGDTACADGLDNDCDGQIDCNDSECSAASSCVSICGDGSCNAGEGPCNCSTDCGAAPVTEANCEDSEDNDCDGDVDCDDSDCNGDEACVAACDCDGDYADNFETGNYDNSTGSLDWSATPWIEIGESNGSRAGFIVISSDLLSRRLKLCNASKGVMRAAGLCAGHSTTLSLLYRRQGLNNSSEYATVEISSDGNDGPWTEVARYAYALPGSDLVYLSDNIDISAYATETTWIRIITSSSMNSADIIFFDNVQVTCSP